MMSGLKTFLFVSVLTTTVTGSAIRADTDSTVSLFAQCAGRFSAEMEFSWLLEDRESETPKKFRSHFVDLIDAVIAPGEGPAVLDRRIKAKMAHIALLSRAQFSQNPVEVRMATQAAERDVAFCRAMLTG